MPPANATTEEHQELLDTLDIASLPRPFRNSHWKPSQRRNKNVKQLLSESSRKEASSMATQVNSGATTPFAVSTTDGTQTPVVTTGASATPRVPNIAQAAQSLSTLVLEKNLRAANPASYTGGPAVTYTNIESAPSLSPAQQHRYCDLTGLPAPYTDPKTRLRYHNREVFGVVRTLGQGVAENFLEARGAHVVLKYEILITSPNSSNKDVRPTKSSPFHPPAPLETGSKKTLRLNRDHSEKKVNLRLVPGEPIQPIPTLHGKVHQLQGQLTLLVVAGWLFRSWEKNK